MVRLVYFSISEISRVTPQSPVNANECPLQHLSDIDLMTKAGRVEVQLILSKSLQFIALQLEMIIFTLLNGTVIGKSRDYPLYYRGI